MHNFLQFLVRRLFQSLQPATFISASLQFKDGRQQFKFYIIVFVDEWLGLKKYFSDEIVDKI